METALAFEGSSRSSGIFGRDAGCVDEIEVCRALQSIIDDVLVLVVRNKVGEARRETMKWQPPSRASMPDHVQFSDIFLAEPPSFSLTIIP